MSFAVRQVTDAECDRLGRLLVDWNEEHLSVFPPEIAAGYRAELPRVRSRLPTCDVLVAEAAGDLVGTVTLVRDAADDGHPWPDGGSVIRLLAVDPDLRGRGIGTALVDECLTRARARGAYFVGLHTAPVMAAARRLYERTGFVRVPDHDFDPGAHYGGDEASPGERWGIAYVLDLRSAATQP